MQKYDLIKNAYYDTKQGYVGAKKLYERLKDKNITMNDIKHFLDNQETKQIYYKPKKPVYFPIVSQYPNHIFQIDLLDVTPLSKYNKGVHFLLMCVDIFTRYAYVEPVKNKSGQDVSQAMKKILVIQKPDEIMADSGKEWINRSFKNLMKENNIEFYPVDPNDHNALGIINSFSRTIRLLINNYNTANNTNTFINSLQDLIYNYNHSVHSTIKSTPANPDIEGIKNINLHRYLEAKQQEQKFEIGDKVRYIINRSAFEKGTNPRWSKQIHTVKNTNSHSYILDNDKKYKYYHLQLIKNVEGLEKERIQQTTEQIKKERTVKRRLNQEGVNMSNIVKSKRESKRPVRYSNRYKNVSVSK